MADNWAPGFNPQAIKSNWDDEEAQDDDIKDDWDQEEETVKPDTDSKSKKIPTKPKSNIDIKEMTEEEKKEAQIKADLSNATELFGLEKSLDEISLKSKEDYQDYVNRLYAKLNLHNKNSLYQDFLEELFKSLSQNLNSDSIRKLSNSLKILSDQKLADERANKTKDAAKSKPKSKAKVKLEADRIKGDFDSFLKDNHRMGYDEDGGDDDFM